MKDLFTMRRLIHCLLLLVLSQTVGLAQYTEGSISGTVTDSAGAVLPGANVTVTNAQTGEARQVTTDSDGLYRVASLRPGSYEVKVEQAGLRPASLKTYKR